MSLGCSPQGWAGCPAPGDVGWTREQDVGAQPLAKAPAGSYARLSRTWCGPLSVSTCRAGVREAGGEQGLTVVPWDPWCLGPSVAWPSSRTVKNTDQLCHLLLGLLICYVGIKQPQLGKAARGPDELGCVSRLPRRPGGRPCSPDHWPGKQSPGLLLGPAGRRGRQHRKANCDWSNPSWTSVSPRPVVGQSGAV